MEANYKQRGFAGNGKLVMSLYQASDPSSSSTVHHVRLVNPDQSSVSIFSEAKANNNNGRDGFLADQSIDVKAASYISTVRQRFGVE
ncbi:hypothetical protein OIU76_000403 [Salix suchowensis]|uniref:Uncharacterized protein n=1 Tax=Salix suchowensis TaxID=1278906 RepID=A0ABQ9B8P2_9ROSI|nr:hypothetical protein IMY05_012G0067000 [Salix suchowensis]KAJ6358674.1 hypothetical protein OIU76_000403 [Salix suchowensis]KAJ6375359.1 hypothetical protein OIU77_000356 [Salix suchowensis]KAJ6386823.1 hypothetical protein OIU78_016701 [Salix suchowensis]